MKFSTKVYVQWLGSCDKAVVLPHNANGHSRKNQFEVTCNMYVEYVWNIVGWLTESHQPEFKSVFDQVYTVR